MEYLRLTHKGNWSNSFRVSGDTEERGGGLLARVKGKMEQERKE